MKKRSIFLSIIVLFFITIFGISNTVFANIGFHFLNGSSFTYKHDGNLIIQTDADYYSGTFNLDICLGKQHIADLTSNEYYVEQDLKTGGTNLVIYSSFLETLEPNEYRINITHSDGSSSFSTQTDLIIEANIDEYDLYISFIDHEYCAYKDGEPYGVGSPAFNVSYNSSNNEYTINLNSDLEVYSYDDSTIITNNEKSLIINGNNHKINVVRTVYEHHPNLIYSSCNLTINNTTFEYDEVLAANNEKYRMQVSWDNDGNNESSFIRCHNGNLNINNSTINCKSYHRCVSATCDGVLVDSLPFDSFITNSTINHTLYPAYFGLLPTVFSSNDITISNSNVVTKAVNYNEDIKSAACGVYNYYGDLNITDGSLIDVTGNPHDHDNVYEVDHCYIGNPAIYGWYVYIEDNSTIKIRDSQMGIYSAMDFSLDNSNIDIDCVYGGILAYTGCIYINMDNIVPSVFSITANGVKEYDGYYIRALQHLNRYYDRSHYYITSDMRTKFIFGSTDGIDSYDINDENNDIQIYSRIYLSDTPKKPTKNNATLVINTETDPILYLYGFGFDNNYENLDIKFDNDTDTYIVNVKDDFNATSFNDDCIYTRKGLNLKIYGEGDLNIDLDCDNSVEYDLTGIGTSGSLSLGDGKNKFNVFINDNVDRNSIDFEYVPLVNAIQCQGNMCIDNTNIKAHIFGNMIYYRQKNKLDSLESIGMYIKNNSILTHELIDINDQNYLINSIRTNGTTYINDSTINSSIDIKSEDSTQTLRCMYFLGPTEITNSNIHYIGNRNSTDNIDVITMGNSRSEYETKFINSLIDIKNCIYALTSMNSPVTIKNCNVDITSFYSCFRSKDPFNLIIDDLNYIDKFNLRKDLTNPIFAEVKTGPIIQTATMDESISSLINLNLPEKYTLKFSLGNDYYNEYNPYDLKNYISALIKKEYDDEYFEDLVISDIQNTAAYSKTELINGSAIDNINVSYKDGTYTLELLDDVTINSNNKEAIKVTSSDLKIVGNKTLELNINATKGTQNDISAIYCNNDIQIGDKNSKTPLNIIVNDQYSIENSESNPLKSYVSAIYSAGDTNIYNSKIISETSSNIVQADEDIVIDNSELIHNIYANYSLDKNKNAEQKDISTLYTKNGSITIKNKSKVTSGFVTFTNYPNIGYIGISTINKNIDINDSNISISAITNFDNVQEDSLSSFAIFTNGDVNLVYSSYTCNNIQNGIYAGKINLSNSDFSSDTYNSSLYGEKSISIKLSKSNKIFSINSHSQGSAIALNPSIFNPNLIEISMPNNYSLEVNDSLDFDINNILDYYKYNLYITEDKPDPSKPSHSDDTNYIIPKTGI